MSTLHLLPRPATRRTRLPALRRWWLRLRSRWLGWRGVAMLQVVPVPVAQAITASEREGRQHQQRLLELNLMFERARAGQDVHGKPGGLAG